VNPRTPLVFSRLPRIVFCIERRVAEDQTSRGKPKDEYSKPPRPLHLQLPHAPATAYHHLPAASRQRAFRAHLLAHPSSPLNCFSHFAHKQVLPLRYKVFSCVEYGADNALRDKSRKESLVDQ
jgi:hypothetical protein